MNKAEVRISKRNYLLLAGFLVAVFVINMLSASRYPVVWADEVRFVDPGASWQLGEGFRSTGWYGQPDDEFFASYAPLYPAAIGAWLSLAELTPTGARSLNFVLIILSACTLWLVVARKQWVTSPSNQMLLVGLITLSYGISFSYRSGRPDTLALFITTLCFLACTIERSGWRRAALATLCALAPLCGLQVLAFATLFSAVVLLYGRAKVFWDVVAVGVGLVLGSLIMLSIFHYHDVTTRMFNEVSHDVTSGLVGGIATQTGFRHANKIPKDPSFLLLTLAAVVLLFSQWRNQRLAFHSALSFTCAVLLIIPAGMYTAAKFPTYYTWMAYAPACVGLIVTLDSGTPSPSAQRVVRGLLWLACAAGLPTQLALASYDWQDRDYARVEHFVDQHIEPTDVVYCSYAAYYAAKPRAAKVYLRQYLPRLNDAGGDHITLLLIDPNDLALVTGALGGHWEEISPRVEPAKTSLFQALLARDIAVGLFAKKYRLRAYRRI